MCSTFGPEAITFSPDGSRVFTANAMSVKVWDTLTGAEALNARELPSRFFGRVIAASPDSRHVLFAGDSATALVLSASAPR